MLFPYERVTIRLAIYVRVGCLEIRHRLGPLAARVCTNMHLYSYAAANMSRLIFIFYFFWSPNCPSPYNSFLTTIVSISFSVVCSSPDSDPKRHGGLFEQRPCSHHAICFFLRRLMPLWSLRTPFPISNFSEEHTPGTAELIGD